MIRLERTVTWSESRGPVSQIRRNSHPSKRPLCGIDTVLGQHQAHRRIIKIKWHTPHAPDLPDPSWRIGVTSAGTFIRTITGMGRRRNASRRSSLQGRPSKPQVPRQPTVSPSGDPGEGSAPRVDSAAQARRLAASTCGWCAGPITVKVTGRLPKWCSAACRQRAWEQSRAAASGRSAVQIVERRVEVPIPAAPRRQDWPRVLGDLARQLDDGRIYSRDLLSLSVPLNGVLDAFARRNGHPVHRQG
jgi:hypothetical protein